MHDPKARDALQVIIPERGLSIVLVQIRRLKYQTTIRGTLRDWHRPGTACGPSRQVTPVCRIYRTQAGQTLALLYPQTSYLVLGLGRIK